MASMVELILPGCGARLVSLLVQRRGRPTLLRLTNGAEAMAWNCVCGRDHDKDWEHMTLNMSPRVPDAPVVFLSAAQVATAADPESGTILYERCRDTAILADL